MLPRELCRVSRVTSHQILTGLLTCPLAFGLECRWLTADEVWRRLTLRSPATHAMRTIIGGDLLWVWKQHCHLLPLLVPWCMLHLARERDGAVLWCLRAAVTISLLLPAFSSAWQTSRGLSD